MKRFLVICSNQCKVQRLVLPNSRLLLAVSGGQDSTSLLYFFTLLKNQWSLQNNFIYCNHLWRIESMEIHYSLMLTHYALKCPVYVTTPFYVDYSLTETNARIWRYSLFARLAFLKQTHFVLTGHSQTDQIESFLLNLISGTGSYGSIALTWKRQGYQPKFICFSEKRYALQSLKRRNDQIHPLNQADLPYLVIYKRNFEWLKYDNSLRLCRPWLFLNRYEIFRLIEILDLPLWTDKTNFQVNCLRNRIRLQLIPLIRFYFNPKIDIALARYLKIWSEETFFFENLMDTLSFNNQLLYSSKKLVIVDISLFTKMPYILQKRFMIYFLKLFFKKRFSNSDVVQILKILFIAIKLTRYQTQPHIFCFSKQLFITCSKNKVYFSQE